MRALLYGVRPEPQPEPDEDNHLLRGLAHTPMRLTEMDDPRFLRPDWVRGLLTDLFLKQTGPFQRLMISLYAGGQLVAGHFGVRLDGVYHPWIASTNPAYGEWSPGQIFFMRAIAAMPGLGLQHYDLGPGHDHYKGAYALSQVQIGEGGQARAACGEEHPFPERRQQCRRRRHRVGPHHRRLRRFAIPR